MSNITSQLGATASRVAERADELGHQAADGLHAAASSIRRDGRQSAHAIEDLTAGTAAKLDQAGSFIQNHDLKHTIGESRRLLRRYPVETLALFAGVGFLTGFALRHLSHSCPRPEARA